MRRDDGMPSERETMRPILEICHDGRIHSYADLEKGVADMFELTPAQRRMLTREGNERKIYNRMRRAVQHMAPAGLVDRPGRGQCKITPAGKKMADDKDVEITWSLLRKLAASAGRKRGRTGRGRRP